MRSTSGRYDPTRFLPRWKNCNGLPGAKKIRCMDGNCNLPWKIHLTICRGHFLPATYRHELTTLQSLNELWQYFVHVANNAEVGNAKDWCFFVFVDGDDVFRTLHAHHVLSCA